MIKLKDILPEALRDYDSNNIDLPANEFNLKDLTFDDVLGNFPGEYKTQQFTRIQPNGQEGPYYRDGVSFPKVGDGMTTIGDLKSFEGWKKEFLTKFGETIILLDPDAEWFDKVKIKNDKFNQQSTASSKAISKYYTDKPSGGFTGD